jgi:hypothetical protein
MPNENKKYYAIAISTVITIIVLYLTIMLGVPYFLTPARHHGNAHSDWMKYLNPNYTLRDIVLPSTHDSLIYKDVNLQDYDGDKESFVKYIIKFNRLPLLHTKLNNWTVTQNNSIYDQLTNGIRCFDIRVASVGNKCMGIHSFTTDTFYDCLSDIDAFTDENPSEIVVILYKSKSEICDLALVSKLHKKILPPTSNYMNLTLDELRKTPIIMLFVGGQPSTTIRPYVYPNTIYTDWIRSYSKSDVKNGLIESLSNHTSDNLFRLHWVIEPQMSDVIFSIFSLRRDAQKMNYELDDFLDNLSIDNKKKINMINVDFENSVDIVSLIMKHYPHLFEINNKDPDSIY